MFLEVAREAKNVTKFKRALRDLQTGDTEPKSDN